MSKVDKGLRNFGVFIRKTRLSKGVNLRQLSDYIGLSKSQIQRIEAGVSEVSLTNAAKFAEAFGFKLSEFLSLAETELANGEVELKDFKRYIRMVHKYHRIEDPTIKKFISYIINQYDRKARTGSFSVEDEDDFE